MYFTTIQIRNFKSLNIITENIYILITAYIIVLYLLCYNFKMYVKLFILIFFLIAMKHFNLTLIIYICYNNKNYNNNHNYLYILKNGIFIYLLSFRFIG